jgi:hypothetical protein
MTTDVASVVFHLGFGFPRRNFHGCAESLQLVGTLFILLLRKVKTRSFNELLVASGVFNFESSYSGRCSEEKIGGSMKSQPKFALLLALGMGVLGAGAAAQERQISGGDNGRLQYTTFNSGHAGTLQPVGWDNHRGCDRYRGCYYQYRSGYRYPAYYRSGHYGYRYYPAPARYYPRHRGWYDRYGRWHNL